MSYDVTDNRIVDPRPEFITDGRANVVDAVMMLHHRIPWNLLRNALNRVLARALDSKIVNGLLSLSPSASEPLVTKFNAALTQVKANKPLSVTQKADIEAVERELFSLPCNLFLGRSDRADDPGDRMDFTPADVKYDGSYTDGGPGALQKQRELLYGQLSKAAIDVKTVNLLCRDLASMWTTHAPAVAPPIALAIATGANLAWWTLGQRPFRHWTNNDSPPRPLTVAECIKLNTRIDARARKLAG